MVAILLELERENLKEINSMVKVVLGEGASNIFDIIHAAANSFLSALEQLLQSVLAGSCRPV